MMTKEQRAQSIRQLRGILEILPVMGRQNVELMRQAMQLVDIMMNEAAAGEEDNDGDSGKR